MPPATHHCCTSSSLMLSPLVSLNRYFSFLIPKSPSLNNLRTVRPQTSSWSCRASLITSPDSFEVGRLIGSYGFMNITSHSAFQSGMAMEYSPADVPQLKVQDVGEGSVKIRLYEGRITQGPYRGTPIIFKVYPGKRAGGTEADMMAANELSAHSLLQSSSKYISRNLAILVGGYEAKTGEQWLAFRDDGKYSAADYAKISSEKVLKRRTKGGNSWNPFEEEQMTKWRRNFVVKLLYGTISGLAYLHNHDRLHQSLGPSSVILNTVIEKEAAYLIPRLRDLAFSVDIRISHIEKDIGTLSEGLWRRATAAGAFTAMEKRAFGIAEDIYEAGLLFAYVTFVPFCEAGIMDSLSLQRLLENTFQLDLEATREYCLADDRLEEAVKFLDIGDQAGWKLLQAMLDPDYRKRPSADALLNHPFLTGAFL